MDHLCYKCQTSIDESLPFCPHCGAPQIRVATPDGEAPESQPSFQVQGPRTTPQVWTAGRAYSASSVQWQFAWKGALLTGIAAFALSLIPIVGKGICLWLLGTGALAVGLYQRRVPGVYVTPGMGMRIGALSGIVFFVISTVWAVFGFLTDSQQFRSILNEQIGKAISSSPDPQAAAKIMNILNTPEGFAGFIVLAVIMSAIIVVVCSAAGGALGASMFGRRNPQ